MGDGMAVIIVTEIIHQAAAHIAATSAEDRKWTRARIASLSLALAAAGGEDVEALAADAVAAQDIAEATGIVVHPQTGAALCAETGEPLVSVVTVHADGRAIGI